MNMLISAIVHFYFFFFRIFDQIISIDTCVIYDGSMDLTSLLIECFLNEILRFFFLLNDGFRLSQCFTVIISSIKIGHFNN